jgi:Uma2 family endonuclease/uncharacterized small protein (DUF1192 family)
MNMTQSAPAIGLSITDQPWQDPPSMPPTDLPYDDGEPMESSWHAASGPLLKACYIAARGGQMTDYYVGVNMFVYFSSRQARNQEYKGPDAYIVHNVDGTRRRLYWAIWDEDGRYPDVIFEFLSPTTQDVDLGSKKQLYEQTFHAVEYFCIAPEVERLLGWRLVDGAYVEITPDAQGRLWSKELQLWLGAWTGVYLGEEHTWPRFYHPDGTLVLLAEETERLRAEQAEQQAKTERQRADELSVQVAALQAEIARLRDTGAAE